MTMNATNPFLSVLAAGISNNAHLYKKLDSSEAARAVDRCLKRIQRSIEAGGGRVIRIGGGEVLAAFDAADSAVNAAIEMQQRIADLPPVSGAKMSIRVGISRGGAVSRAGQTLEDCLAEEAAHVAGIAKSGQILAIGRICEALPETLRALAADTKSTLVNESGRKETLVKIRLPETPIGVPRPAASLRLRYGGITLVLDEHKPVIDMGRDGTCDIIIRDPRASRHHAMMKRRENLIVLIDSSTNGTYVTIEGHSEQFVKHGECVLYGNGVIAFAASSTAPEADCAQFECA
jgi:hypothetical protein